MALSQRKRHVLQPVNLGGERNAHQSGKPRQAPTFHGDYGFTPVRSPKDALPPRSLRLPKD